MLSEKGNKALYEKVNEYVNDLLENADHARNLLEDTDFGTFDVISPALDSNYDR